MTGPPDCDLPCPFLLDRGGWTGIAGWKVGKVGISTDRGLRNVGMSGAEIPGVRVENGRNRAKRACFGLDRGNAVVSRRTERTWHSSCPQ